MDRFDLEDSIMSCWNVVEDMDFINRATHEDREKAINTIKHLYEMRFYKLWSIFEQLIKEKQL